MRPAAAISSSANSTRGLIEATAYMNIVSVSWADHLTFGEGEGRLDTAGKAARRMRAWRDEVRASALHGRELRTRIPGRVHAARGYPHPPLMAARALA